jgi:GDPmannose 4,6-dehydratase
MTINYRESYGIFGVSGILFNHESPLRGLEFVTRKISSGLARIKLGKEEAIELGNLDAKRDWGFAREYVDGMWRMIQAPNPDVYVLASGRNASVRDFISLMCKAAEIDIAWQGHGCDEMGIDTATGKTIVRINPRYFRPAEVDALMGNAAKAKRELGWEAKTSLEELCKMMFEADVQRIRRNWPF